MPPLPEFLNPTQWSAFVNGGTLPNTPGMCLLCLRRHFQLAVDIFRDNLSALAAPFTNPVNCPGGYNDTCTISVYGDKVAGGPVVRHYSGGEKMLRLEVNREGQWRISEEAILWSHPKC